MVDVVVCGGGCVGLVVAVVGEGRDMIADALLGWLVSLSSWVRGLLPDWSFVGPDHLGVWQWIGGCDEFVPVGLVSSCVLLLLMVAGAMMAAKWLKWGLEMVARVL